MHDVHAPWGRELRCTLDEHEITSTALHANPLGDPPTRALWVLTPPHVAADQPTPVIYLIQGFTGHIGMWTYRANLRESALERIDAALAEPDHPPVRLVFVDCFTSLGGSQFVDSPAVGAYHTYLCDEVVGFVDDNCPTLAAAAHRGIAGKSSGGYGAMITPMLRPDLFGGLATHAGDALFEACFGGDFRVIARTLRDHYGGSWDVFWEDWRSRPHGTGPEDDTIINAWAMAACWSADPDGTVNLPFDVDTGRIVDDVWQRWLDWDPVRMVPGNADALRGLRAIWIDAGTRDQFWLDLGAMAFREALTDIGVTPTQFGLFDATHSGIEYRYPLAVRHLAERLQP
ncbi:MAG TPA: alpha/beta hydrolase-fold protein [Euzebyales bacterium]|nr:alpha/beta hydrolase-fold protein [Euzebyales bacterium]